MCVKSNSYLTKESDVQNHASSSTSLNSCFQNHIDVMNTDEIFTCNICNYSASLKGVLKKHISEVHNNEKPFKCSLCCHSALQKHSLNQIADSVNECDFLHHAASNVDTQSDNTPLEVSDEEDEHVTAQEDDEEPSEARMQWSASERNISSKKLVCSIDEALNPANYEKKLLPSDNKLFTGRHNDRLCKKKYDLQWSCVPPKPSTINAENRKSNSSVVKPVAMHAVTPLDCFSLFLSDEILDIIVLQTNENIKPFIEIVKDKTGFKYIHATDVVEIRAFIGLIYMRGLMRLSHMDQELLFSDVIGPPIFSAVMSKNRFCFLHAHICFDDPATRNDRWKTDKFAAIRDIYNIFNNNCAKTVIPSDYNTIDETLYSCHVKNGFKIYNANKPARCGLLFKSINSARFPFTYHSVVYSGRPVQTPSPYYTPSILETIQNLIRKLMQFSDLKGINISFGRGYTSIDLFNWLLENKMTGIGTIMSNKTGIPKEILETKDREEYSYNVLWEAKKKKLSLHSYVVNTKSSGKKECSSLI